MMVLSMISIILRKSFHLIKLRSVNAMLKSGLKKDFLKMVSVVEKSKKAF